MHKFEQNLRGINNPEEKLKDFLKNLLGRDARIENSAKKVYLLASENNEDVSLENIKEFRNYLWTAFMAPESSNRQVFEKEMNIIDGYLAGREFGK